jgi:lysozyme
MEGFSAEAYQDVAGYWTIGYGHRCQRDRAPVTKEEAVRILMEDLEVAEHIALHISPCLKAEVNRLAAITDFVFNLGALNYATSSLHRLVNNKEWLKASEEILKWNHGHVDGKLVELAGLTKRRLQESAWLRTG